MAQDPNEMTKKNTKGYKQKYTDDTEENEAVRKAIIKTPIFLRGMVKNVVQGLSRGIPKEPKEPEDSKTKKKESKKSLSQLGASVLEEEVEKKSNGGAVHTMPDGTKMKGAKHGMKHGGAVKGKKCRMDGIAVRGKTRAKQRSK